MAKHDGKASSVSRANQWSGLRQTQEGASGQVRPSVFQEPLAGLPSPCQTILNQTSVLHALAFSRAIAGPRVPVCPWHRPLSVLLCTQIWRELYPRICGPLADAQPWALVRRALWNVAITGHPRAGPGEGRCRQHVSTRSTPY